MKLLKLRTLTCPQCGQRFTTSSKTARWCSKRCAGTYHANLDPAKRAAQLAIVRALRKPSRPKPDLSVFDVPVFIPPPVVEEPAELPSVPLIDHASRIMLGWAWAWARV